MKKILRTAVITIVFALVSFYSGAEFPVTGLLWLASGGGGGLCACVADRNVFGIGFKKPDG